MKFGRCLLLIAAPLAAANPLDAPASPRDARASLRGRLERLAPPGAGECRGRHRWSRGELLAILPRLPAAERLVLQTHFTDDAWLAANAGLLLSGGSPCNCASTAIPIADLGVTKTPSAAGVNAGDPLGYTLSIRNYGGSDAANARLTDTLPAELSFVSSVPGSPTCAFSAGTLTCGWASLANGATQTVTLNTTVSASANGGVTNSASVSSDTGDNNGTNNLNSATVTVTPIQPGRVPDTLLVAKNAGDPALLDFTWSASCGGAVTRYAVFEGALGAGYSHAPLNNQCAVTGTSLSAQAPAAGNRYYLIVPESATAEGSYGVDSNGAEIPVGALRCQGSQILGGVCP